jgi:hypothetical protein
LVVTGEWPSKQIDHKNLKRADDSFLNLREATQTQNSGNQRVQKNNRLGIKGVGAYQNKYRAPRYRARIRVNGRLVHLGYFSTPAEANVAYAVAAQKHFGEFARSV